MVLVAGLVNGVTLAQIVAAASSTVYVSNLQPSWTAVNGGGVYSAYIGPPAYDYVSPGSTAIYLGRQSGIIKAGLNVDADGHYWDEGLFGFQPDVTVNEFAANTLSYDVVNQEGTNPVWMTIEIDTGVLGDRSDNVVYQFVPTTNPAGWHTVDAGAGQWQKWNNNDGDVTGNPLISLSDVVAAHPGLNVVRTYLRLGMGDSYHGTGLGTVAWIDTITIGGVMYDFVIPSGTTPWTLNIVNGSTTYPMTQTEFESLPQVTINVTDMHGTHDWTGVPLWRLVSKVDGSNGTFNDALAATNYSVKAVAIGDSYTRCVGPTASGTTIAHNDNLIVANMMDGSPLPVDSAPLKIVGIGLISSRFVSKLASIEMVYIVNVTAGTHGTSTPVGNTMDVDGVVGARFNSNQTFSITPEPGYHVDALTVDGVSLPGATSYSFNGVNANHTIAASFALGLPQPAWDLNGDHTCNIGDVVKVGLRWGNTGTAGWIPEDLNKDGVINIGDVVILGLNWGQTW